jgi:hypothetical protein
MVILGIITIVVAAGASGTYYYYNLEQQTQEQQYQDCRAKFAQIISGYSSILKRANSIVGSFDIGGELRAQYAGLQNEAKLSAQDCIQFNERLNDEFSSNMQYLQGQISKFTQ